MCHTEEEAWPSIANNGTIKNPNPLVVFDTPSDSSHDTLGMMIPRVRSNDVNLAGLQ